MGRAWNGRCRCGETTFIATGDPLATSACHCTGCQRMSAGPYSLSAIFPAPAFRILSGEVVLGGLRQGDRHSHCRSCLSWLWSVPAVMPEIVAVRTPMLEDAADLPPLFECFTSEKLSFAQTGAPYSFSRFPAPSELPALLEAFAGWEGRPKSQG